MTRARVRARARIDAARVRVDRARIEYGGARAALARGPCRRCVVLPDLRARGYGACVLPTLLRSCRLRLREYGVLLRLRALLREWCRRRCCRIRPPVPRCKMDLPERVPPADAGVTALLRVNADAVDTCAPAYNVPPLPASMRRC
ncbi:Hypothetical predicted protein, partial [Scomber scombrus]